MNNNVSYLLFIFIVLDQAIGGENLFIIMITTAILDKFVSRPYFGDTETVITVQQGEAAFFDCHVFNLANQTVSEVLYNILINSFV